MKNGPREAVSLDVCFTAFLVIDDSDPFRHGFL